MLDTTLDGHRLGDRHTSAFLGGNFRAGLYRGATLWCPGGDWNEVTGGPERRLRCAPRACGGISGALPCENFSQGAPHAHAGGLTHIVTHVIELLEWALVAEDWDKVREALEMLRD